LILHPEKDIFIKEDQQKLTALLADVGAETKTMRGGHLTFVSSPELYIGAIRGFLNRLQLRKDDDNRWTYDDK
jgi:pimeloyl-ACP methyl ester carboxylesterase